MRNELTEISDIDHIVDTRLDIQVNKLISTSNMECSIESQSFDSCTVKLTKLQMPCQLPFMQEAEEKLFCKTKEDAEKALQLFQSSYDNCNLPCNQVQVDIALHPVDWLYILTNPKFPISTIIPGYYIKLPTKVQVSEMQWSYDIISFIAEFGGWVGLLLGISVLGGISKLLETCSETDTSKLYQVIKFVSLMILKVGCGGCLIYILVQCCRKMANGEKQLDVNIENSLPVNLSLSLCSMENLYVVPYLRANLSYIGDTSNFWLKTAELKNKLDSMTVVFQNGSKFEIIKYGKSNNNAYPFYLTNVPKYETYIENCHSVDLKDWNQIVSIDVISMIELSIYVHVTGQLLNPGGQLYTFMNYDSVNNR